MRYPDRFIAPHSVCLDDEDKLYVVEFVAEGGLASSDDYVEPCADGDKGDITHSPLIHFLNKE